MKTPLACLALLIALTGCASSELSKARTLYSDCLTANPSNDALCEPQRMNLEVAVYEDQMRSQRIGNALMGFGNGVNSNRPQTQVNVNPQPSMWMQNMGGRSYNCNNIGGMVNCH